VVTWDWTSFFEETFAIAFGVGLGGWFVVDRFEMAALRIASHPNLRKIANAADKMPNMAEGGGGWPGLIGKGLDFLTGGRFSQGGGARIEARGGPGAVPVIDDQGNQIGWMRPGR